MENQLYVALKNNKLFLDIDLEEIDLSNVQGQLKPLKEGEILYREEDSADHIYLVVSGEINLLKKKLLGSTKSFIFEENDFFGYDEIEENTSRTSTAVALRDSYLISLSEDELQLLLERNHLIKTNLLNFSDIEPSIDNSIEPTDEVYPDNESGKEMHSSDESEISDHAEEKPNKKNTDVTSFEQSLKDDLIDKHDTSIEEDSSPYEEEIRDDAFQKIHSDEMPEDQVDKNLNEFSNESEEPLFPEDDDEESGPEQESSGPSEEMEESTSLDEETLAAIEAQDDPPALDETEEKKSSRKLSDFDEAFYDAFSEESNINKADEEKSDSENLPQENEPISENDSNDNFDLSIDKDTSEDSSSDVPPVFSEDKEKVLEDLENSSESESSEIVEEFETDDENKEDQQSDEDVVQNEEVSPEEPSSESEETESKPSANSFSSRIISGSTRLESDQLRKIIRASQLVNSNIKIDEVLNNIVSVASDLTEADRGTLYLIDRENNELWSKVAMGSETKEIRLKIGEGVAGWVASNRDLVNIEDVQTDDRFSSEFDKSSGYQTKSMLCFPIKDREDQIVGVLQLLNSKNGKFSIKDEEFLSAISIQCALALQNAEMLEQLLHGERVSSLGKMTNFLIQDIKKPVLVSKRYAEHLKSKELNKDADQIVEMILDQLTQVADLVQTTSSYAEGKAVLRTSRVSFNEVIKEFADRLDSYIKSRSSQIELKLDKDVKVQLDSKEFFQCFNHLIRNSCDAMPDGGKITVSTNSNKEEAILTVKDDGNGISENLIDRIFDPFMTHGKKEGTGLGLTITKKIVEGHSGTITVESGLGEGTSFIIKLPIASAL